MNASKKYYTIWTLSNLFIMLTYSMGLQKIFLIKNVLVGWLGVSPLVGAAIVCQTSVKELLLLAMIGFGFGVAREILKDIQDVQIDKIAGKATIPNTWGSKLAHRIAYSIVGMCCAACWTPRYRQIFGESPVYMVATSVGTIMCGLASRMSLAKGQSMLKKSIYVLLLGMIGGLAL